MILCHGDNDNDKDSCYLQFETKEKNTEMQKIYNKDLKKYF
jgi:hypothetical protein